MSSARHGHKVIEISGCSPGILRECPSAFRCMKAYAPEGSNRFVAAKQMGKARVCAVIGAVEGVGHILGLPSLACC